MKNKRQNPVKTKKIESEYYSSLSKISNYVGHVIESMIKGLPIEDIPRSLIMDMMRKYSENLIPWSIKTATDFVNRINIQDVKAFKEYSNEISNELKKEIENIELSGKFKIDLIMEQVELIKSIPIDAAVRVNDLCIKALEDGTRSKEIMEELLRTTKVSKSKARLIVRTETARTSSRFTQYRAEKLGITHYIWTTSHDSDVRSSHREMDGKVIAFNDPPSFPDGHRYHAGEFCNCRCWKKLIIPDE